MVRPNALQVQARTVREIFKPGDPGIWVHPEWEADFTWVAQGTTGRIRWENRGPWDFALFGKQPVLGARSCWERLGSSLGFEKVVHSRQIHGAGVLVQGRGMGRRGAGVRSRSEGTGSKERTGSKEGTGPAEEAGWNARNRSPQGRGPTNQADVVLAADADGHVCGAQGILLGVTIADCVPVFLVDSQKRVVGLLHAGWRGAVAGILEEGIERLRMDFEVHPGDLHLHLGPAICRDCFEVGPEVHRAMGLPDPGRPGPVDLRGHLADRGAAAGVEPGRITESAWCTLCDESPFFSHRRGEGGRQVGFLGIRDSGADTPFEFGPDR